jgi:antitoxin HigA-1
MNRLHYTPIHPGEVLKDELEEVGLTQSALAKHIGVLPKTINEICRGKRGISAEMAMKLSKALGGSPQFWLNCKIIGRSVKLMELLMKILNKLPHNTNIPLLF